MVKSKPRAKMSSNGLKIKPVKDQGQKTLEEAIQAGESKKLMDEAKKLRVKALQEQDEVLVRILNLIQRLTYIYKGY